MQPLRPALLGFRRKNRLLVPGEFRRVFKAGKKHRGAFFTLFSSENSGSPARLGLAIAKKRVRLAVDRNRVRRLVRESFRHYQTRLESKDIVVIAHHDLNTLSNALLNEDLHRQWQRIAGTLNTLYN